MNLKALNTLGLMSGTSLDGVDGVLARLKLQNNKLEWQIIDRKSRNYPTELRQKLSDFIQLKTTNISEITQIHTQIGHVYADLVAQFQRDNKVDLVALSGQTVYHIPRVDATKGWHTKSTLQLGEAAFVAERCKLKTISDFRQSDIAAGGQGAPLVPFGDYVLYGEEKRARAIHNLGGISNLSYLPANQNKEDVFAFDTGPANCLMDDACQKYYNLPFDKDGKIAASGTVDGDLLNRLNIHYADYLNRKPPKTTGRELFNLTEIEPLIEAATKPNDLLATLSEFTAESIARAYTKFVIPNGLDEILFAGGGALNPVLMQKIKGKLDIPIKTFEDMNWNSKDREALSFAVMAYYANFGLENIVSSATGARQGVVAGKISLL